MRTQLAKWRMTQMKSPTRKSRIHKEKLSHEWKEDHMTTHTATIHRNFAHRGARPPSGLALLAAATFALLLCGHTAATAATRWVYDNAGSYSPPGTSCNNAGYSTIQTAVDAASPFDV